MKCLLHSLFSKLGVQTKEGQKQIFVQFVKFGLVGLSNTAVSWVCYYLFLWINQDLYIVGSLVGTIVSIVNAFFWNDNFVFKGGNQEWKNRLFRLGKTYLSYSGTSILSIALLWLEVRFGVSKTIAPIVNMIITIPLNFLINKYWTFRNDK